MEIIKMAITRHLGAFLHVEELIEVAKLQKHLLRKLLLEKLQLAFDLCLVLTKKGHGPIWDLGAAKARGPRAHGCKFKIPVALLCFTDDESISELLHKCMTGNVIRVRFSLISEDGRCFLAERFPLDA
ncbi:unnamed protein product [Arabis nemorensis]|uniref:Uncharacterized protein n=1 Tax=Arabis nemorensis TaxID=586526 RepID=A0A565BE69_9BRAS|nr:unnamed protein product [Arabis nemorensis]